MIFKLVHILVCDKDGKAHCVMQIYAKLKQNFLVSGVINCMIPSTKALRKENLVLLK